MERFWFIPNNFMKKKCIKETPPTRNSVPATSEPHIFQPLSYRYFFMYVPKDGWRDNFNFQHSPCSQPTIKCSKLKMETLEKGVKYVQS